MRPGNNTRFTNNYNLKFGEDNNHDEGDNFGYLGTMWWRMTMIEQKNGPNSGDEPIGRMPTWNEIIDGIIAENKTYIDNKYKHQKDKV